MSIGSSAGHFLIKCSCGNVIAQCRCPGSKREEIRQHPSCGIEPAAAVPAPPEASATDCQFCHTGDVSLEAKQASNRLERLPLEIRKRIQEAFGYVPFCLCARDFLQVLQYANVGAADPAPL
jgi:hypothetical protein